jgi:hypothetical protein
MAHEDLNREHTVRGSSDRSFGVVFVIVFLLIAAWPMLDRQAPRWWAAGLAVAIALVVVVKPALLAVPNRLWMRLGLLLGRIVSPLALAVVFYAVLTPLGAMMRLTGKDPLRRRREPDAASYWLLRQPPGPPPTSMTNQF